VQPAKDKLEQLEALEAERTNSPAQQLRNKRATNPALNREGMPKPSSDRKGPQSARPTYKYKNE